MVSLAIRVGFTITLITICLLHPSVGPMLLIFPVHLTDSLIICERTVILGGRRDLFFFFLFLCFARQLFNQFVWCVVCLKYQIGWISAAVTNRQGGKNALQ